MALKLLGLLLAASVAATQATASYNKDVIVSCNRDSMAIQVPGAGLADVAIDKWRRLPECQFARGEDRFEISLSLEDDIRSCGATKVTNIAKGTSLYYQRLLMEYSDGTEASLLVKCVPNADGRELSHNIVRRDLPPNFAEPDYIEITSEVTGSAPIPVLGVGVKQDNSLVQGAINVAPGTPLTMEVYLDGASAGTYGILVSYLEVTDNSNKKETIIYNGCTIDPNLFENFATLRGDTLTAAFRAFKFPESNFVLFRGTVDVCLDKCQGITCSDGQIGFGRKRRAVDQSGADSNKLYQVSLSTIIYFTENITSQRSSEMVADEVSGRVIAGMPAALWENPLMRESPDSPPSVRFSDSGSTVQTTLSAGLAVMVLAFSAVFNL